MCLYHTPALKLHETRAQEGKTVAFWGTPKYGIVLDMEAP